MIVDSGIVKNSKCDAAMARDNLTHMAQNKHFAKVCCVCDQFIVHGQEARVSMDHLKKAKTQSMLRKNLQWLTSECNLNTPAAKKVMEYYVPVCLIAAHKRLQWLTNLYLSPRSYYVEINRKKNAGFGCCRSCKSALNSKSEKPFYCPKYAIANGLMRGPTPKQLSDLNETELCMVSLARVNRHVFQFDAGAHKQITGWHHMYANDVEAVSKVSNWCINRLDNDDSDNTSTNGDDENDVESGDCVEELFEKRDAVDSLSFL